MTNNRPDPSQFMAAYRAACVNQILNAPIRSNCQQDPGINLFNLKDFQNADFFDVVPVTKCDTTKTADESEDVDLAQMNCISYTAGWITRSIIHNSCLENINRDDRVSEDHSLLNTERSYSAVSQKLESFLKLIVGTFKKQFTALLSMSNVGIKSKLTHDILNQNTSDLLCETCTRLVCDKYTNMLVKGELKQLNKNLKKPRTHKRNKTTESEKAKKLNIVSNKSPYNRLLYQIYCLFLQVR